MKVYCDFKEKGLVKYDVRVSLTEKLLFKTEVGTNNYDVFSYAACRFMPVVTKESTFREKLLYLKWAFLYACAHLAVYNPLYYSYKTRNSGKVFFDKTRPALIRRLKKLSRQGYRVPAVVLVILQHEEKRDGACNTLENLDFMSGISDARRRDSSLDIH